MSLISERLNEVLLNIDPVAYESHQQLAKALEAKYAHVRSRKTIDPLLFQGRSIIFNRQTPGHFDRREPPAGWTPILALGDFQGGYIRSKRLGLRMWFGGGACVWIRGGIHDHEIEPFTPAPGSQRISIAHFCHASVWDIMKIPYNTGAMKPEN